jgi:hypothetical protein
MTKLSDTALVILAAACQREGARVLPLTANLKGGAVNVVLGSLHKRGLIEDVPAGTDDDVWAEQDGMPVALRATSAAFEALGIEGRADMPEAVPSRTPKAQGHNAHRAPSAQKEAGGVAPKRETKQDMLIGMLRRPDGATVAEIMAVTGWLAHSICGAIAGALRKRLGLDVGSEKVEGRGRVYRLPAG